MQGLFSVINGFLDILLPEESRAVETRSNRASSPSKSDLVHEILNENKEAKQTPLFTVKWGGIAGYLGKYFLLLLRMLTCIQSITL